MKNQKILITPVILSGGAGTRLWPLSRKDLPKQFINLFKNKSLFELTINRFLGLEKETDIIIDEFLIVTSEEYRFLTMDVIKSIDLKKPFRIILEPEKKNTAPALTLASLVASEKNNQSILFVSPSDSFVENEEAFYQTAFKACKLVSENSIITLGIKPSFASEEYGYIKVYGDGVEKRVESFKEKPILEVANKIFDDKKHLWNSGIFILHSKTWIQSIKRSNLSIYESVQKSILNKTEDGLFIRPDKEKFRESPADSIDYAVIEKFKNLNLSFKVIELDAGWSDLGSYNLLFNISEKDKENNSITGEVLPLNSNNNYVNSSSRSVCLLGVSDLIVIEMPDVIFIANKNNMNEIKQFLNFLETKKPNLLSESSRVFRPWGFFDEVLTTDNCKVKKISLNPNSAISYQSHKHRCEHWIVIKGKATIILNDKEHIILPNESFFIEKNDKHRLINNENKELEIIEIQFGEILLEEDIIRYVDSYDRI